MVSIQLYNAVILRITESVTIWIPQRKGRNESLALILQGGVGGGDCARFGTLWEITVTVGQPPKLGVELCGLKAHNG